MYCRLSVVVLLLVLAGGLTACSDGKSHNNTPETPPTPARGNLQLATARSSGHTLTLLNDGQILVVGGLVDEKADNNAIATASAELIDPKTNQITTTGSMLQHRRQHSATRLQDGKVLIAGGDPFDGTVSRLPTAEIYDPATRQFHYTHQLLEGARSSHTATLLADGKVLIVGGNSLGADQVYKNAELFDPRDESFTPVYSQMTHGRTLHCAVTLESGHVLIVGGIDWFNRGDDTPYTADMYYPEAQRFSPIPIKISDDAEDNVDSPRCALLPSGKVLIVNLHNTFIYDETSNTFVKQSTATQYRDYAPLIALPDGSAAWLSGQRKPGTDTFDLLATVDTFSEAHPQFQTRWSLATPRLFSEAIVDEDGWLWVIAGKDSKNRDVALIEAFNTHQ